MKSMSAIRAVKANQEDSILSLSGITGVDIGKKIVKGKVTDETSIRVYVEKKLAPKDVAEGQRIPKEIDGVKTDVIERRYVLHSNKMALADVKPQADTTSYATLVGGISIMNIMNNVCGVPRNVGLTHLTISSVTNVSNITTKIVVA